MLISNAARRFWGVFTAAVLSLGIIPANKIAFGQEGNDEGWIELFDGESLTGWHKNPKPIGHGTGGKWSVEDGAIVGEQDPPGNGGILLTDKTFGDFELSIDMKPDWGIDSGVFVRSNDRGQCFQMMVDYHEAGNVGHIYGEGTGGFNNRPFEIFGRYNDEMELVELTTRPVANKPPQTYSISGEEWIKAWKLGDWNNARIRVGGQSSEDHNLDQRREGDRVRW